MSASAERRRKGSVQSLFKVERGDAHGLAHFQYRLVAAAAGEGDAGRRVVLVKLGLAFGQPHDSLGQHVQQEQGFLLPGDGGLEIDVQAAVELLRHTRADAALDGHGQLLAHAGVDVAGDIGDVKINKLEIIFGHAAFLLYSRTPDSRSLMCMYSS